MLTIPVLLALLIAANPIDLRERVRSAFQPHGDTDSNEFRRVCRKTGIEMIKAHPWFGLGPEQVKAQFQRYVPADVPRPLPSGWYGHLHNIYLHYAAERGIPTMLALMWLLGKMLFDFIRHVRLASGDARAILHGAIAVMVAMLLVGYFELNLGDTEVLTVFLVTALAPMWPWTQSETDMCRREFLAFIAGGAVGRSASTPVVETVRGPVPVAKLGSVLIHEHILVDFIGADKVNPGRYNTGEVLRTRFPNSRL